MSPYFYNTIYRLIYITNKRCFQTDGRGRGEREKKTRKLILFLFHLDIDGIDKVVDEGSRRYKYIIFFEIS